MRILFAAIFTLFATVAMAAQKEDQVRTCEAVLGDKPVASECARIFKLSADCCIQYDEKRLAKACAKMSSTNAALTCFSEIHEVGFWKSELLPENEPGLADQFIQQWKKSKHPSSHAVSAGADEDQSVYGGEVRFGVGGAWRSGPSGFSA